MKPLCGPELEWIGKEMRTPRQPRSAKSDSLSILPSLCLAGDSLASCLGGVPFFLFIIFFFFLFSSLKPRFLLLFILPASPTYPFSA